jgi:hypothetical protein
MVCVCLCVFSIHQWLGSTADSSLAIESRHGHENSVESFVLYINKGCHWKGWGDVDLIGEISILKFPSSFAKWHIFLKTGAVLFDHCHIYLSLRICYGLGKLPLLTRYYLSLWNNMEYSFCFSSISIIFYLFIFLNFILCFYIYLHVYTLFGPLFKAIPFFYRSNLKPQILSTNSFLAATSFRIENC